MSRSVSSPSLSPLLEAAVSPSSSVVSLFILRSDDAETEADDAYLDGTPPAFMAVHKHHLHSTPRPKDTPPLFSSSSSVKLPALSDSNQILLSQRPSPSLLYGSQSSSSSSTKNLDSLQSASPQQSNGWDNLNHSNFLREEIAKQFGEESVQGNFQKFYADDDPSKRSSILESLMNKRNKERLAKRENFLKVMDDLNQQRQQLLDAKERISDQRRNVMGSPSGYSFRGQRSASDTDWLTKPRPSLRRAETDHTERPVDKFIRQMETNLPAEIAKYNRMRDQHMKDFNRTRKPYGGELGPQSFEAWQMDDYYMCRSIVEEEVDKFLNQFFRPNIGLEAERAAVAADHLEWEKHRRALNQSEAVQLLMEAILLEETRAMSWEVAEEVINLINFICNKSDMELMRKAEEIATGSEDGRSTSDPTYNLVTKAFFGLVDEHKQQRPDVWGHSQCIQTRGSIEEPIEPEAEPSTPSTLSEPPEQSVHEEETEEDEEEAELLHFHDIVPLDLRQIEPRFGESKAKRRKKDKYLRYMRREVQYFKEFSATNLTMNIAQKCKGIFNAKVSPNGQFIAIGTLHGDIIVYDFHFDPMRPVRAIGNKQKRDDPVIDLSWSIDSQQLITINQTGVLQMWSMSSSGPLPHNPSGLDIRPDESGILPEKLTQMLALDASSSDLHFVSGPLAESGAQSSSQPRGPVLANFSPSVTLFGTQNSACIALDNGDLVRCDFEERTYGNSDSYQPGHLIIHHDVNQENTNRIGQGIPAELFRGHKDIIVLICFVDLLGDMITVDRKGYIYHWRSSKNNLSSYDWYQPHKKYKLDMAKTMYSPVPNAKPKILFTDRQSKMSQEELQDERIAVERKLENLDLGDPWHQEFSPQRGTVTQVFAPREKIPDSGSIFHVVVRHALSEQISSHYTLVYRPIKVPSTKFLCALQTPDGSSILFMLLFPEYPPKEAHISILLLDIHSMKLKNWRRDIDIDNSSLYKQLLEEDAIACDITRAFGNTGSQYLIVNIAGQLSAYSMNTGLKVLRTEDPKFPINDGFDGLRISSRGYSLAASAQIVTVSVNGRFYVLAYTDDPTTKKIMNPLAISVLELADENTNDDRILMKKALEIWKQHPPVPPPELRIDNVTMEMDDVQPIEIFVKGVIMDLIDAAVTQRVGGFLDTTARASEDRQRHYDQLLQQWQVDQGKTPPRQSARPPLSRQQPPSTSSTPRPSRRGHRL